LRRRINEVRVAALKMRDASCKLSWAKDKQRERERERGLCYAKDDAKVSISSPFCVCAQLSVNSACFCWAWEICKTVTSSPS